DRYKGVDHVIRALQVVRATVPEGHLLVVGDGTDRPRLEQLAHDLGLGEAVGFPGWRSADELAELYATCEVFALPSKKEGLGLVFVEAMAAGTPVVAARAGATPEVVSHGAVGFLYDYGDIRGLAGGIALLLKEHELRRRMSVCATERSQKEFGMES